MGRGRAPCCDKSKVKSGAWTPEEDFRLVSFIHAHGHPNWRALPSQAGLLRCGKSCRLRWINYLRPNVKRGNFTRQEEEIVIKLHQSLGNKWSKIAASLPGRTDNEIKNIWNTHLKKKVMMKNDSRNGKYGDGKESPSPDDQRPSYSSSLSSSYSNSNDQNMILPHLDDQDMMKNIEPESEAKEASLSHSCSFSSSNNSNDIVGPKGASAEVLIDHEFKEWLRCLENELGLGHEHRQEEEEEEGEEKAFSHGDDHDHDRGLVQIQVQEMNQIIINDDDEEDDITIDQSLINDSISSWQVLFSSLPPLMNQSSHL